MTADNRQFHTAPPRADVILRGLGCGRRGCACLQAERRGHGSVHCPVPGHDDSSPSFSVHQDGDRVLVHCFGGCSQDAIITALTDMGLWGGRDGPPVATFRGRWGTEPVKRARSGATTRTTGTVVAVYPYHDEAGHLLAEKLRHEPKAFTWRRPDGQGGYTYTLGDGRRTLYRLPELLAAAAEDSIYIAAGEKDTDRLRAAGLTATTTPGGEGEPWHADFTPALAGRRVVVLVDNDPTGIKHGEEVAQALRGSVASLQVVRLPGLPDKGDVSDWLDQGHTLDELRQLVAVWPEWNPPSGPDDQTVAAAARCAHCPETDEKAVRALARAEAAEQKARAHKRFIDDIAAVAVDPNFGEEVRLWIRLAIAHYRGDPELQPLTGNRWRLTQKLAQKLCGKKNLKTAGAYALKLARARVLPLGPEEEKRFTKADGHKVDAFTLTYLWPPPASEDAGPAAEATQQTLLTRAKRLQARRETRGDARRFNGCPDHPHARYTMRRHCSVCDRCLEPKGANVWSTTPTQRPDSDPIQTLDAVPSTTHQSLDDPPQYPGSVVPFPLSASDRDAAIAEWTAELVAATGADPHQTLETPARFEPRNLYGAPCDVALCTAAAAFQDMEVSERFVCAFHAGTAAPVADYAAAGGGGGG